MSDEMSIDDLLMAMDDPEPEEVVEVSSTPKSSPKIEPNLTDVDCGSSVGVPPAKRKSATPSPTTEEEARNKILSTLPVHAVSGNKSGKGRPKAVNRAPSVVDLQYHAEMAAQKSDYIENDPVVLSSTKRQDPISTLRIIKKEIAKEAAALGFQRLENEKYGKDTSQISVRRVDALSKVVAVELELKKLDGDFLDLKSEKFQRIFKFWIETLQEVAQDTLTPELIDLFFNRLGTKLDGWEDRASEASKE